jgi:Pin2-interacting protein X1
MLLSQGWTPGSILGAKDAAHSAHYTAANASHIRVLLKDDNLGLGAQRGKAEGQNFGLLGFNDLLGRLNGKDEVVIQQEQQKRVEIGKILYAQQRWGGTRFVSGGLLVGDKIEEKTDSDEQSKFIKMGHTENGKNVAQTETKDAVVADAAMEEDKVETLKQRKKVEKASRRAEKAARKAKKEKSRNKSSKETSEDDSSKTASTAEKESRKESKEERRQRKLERRAKKEERKKRATNAEVTQSAIVRVPAMVGLSVRQRYIKQKRMAMMDPQAMREVS